MRARGSPDPTTQPTTPRNWPLPTAILSHPSPVKSRSNHAASSDNKGQRGKRHVCTPALFQRGKPLADVQERGRQNDTDDSATTCPWAYDRGAVSRRKGDAVCKSRAWRNRLRFGFTSAQSTPTHHPQALRCLRAIEPPPEFRWVRGSPRWMPPQSPAVPQCRTVRECPVVHCVRAAR